MYASFGGGDIGNVMGRCLSSHLWSELVGLQHIAIHSQLSVNCEKSDSPSVGMCHFSLC
jgi:hypothetical protein